MARIVCGLSGGVDSAVAALLLRRAGHDVHGLHMQNWDDDDGHCTAAEDLQDARAVARELGIPLHVVDLSAAYRERVFAQFLDELRAGRTPNPDVLCNREIKFGDCLAHARRLGAERFATGHYARLRQAADGPALLKAADRAKDQSYFLHAVPRAQFAAVDFPLGELDKPRVRELARAAGLPVHAKRDSTGICFIGERPFREFLRQHLPDAPGPVLSADGERLGEHPGLHHFTLGQRGGIGLGGLPGGSGAAWYVAAKRAADRALIVVQGNDHPLLGTDSLETGPINWLGPAPAPGDRTAVQLRYRQADQPAVVAARTAHDGLRLAFDPPQRAVTCGQSAVLYDGERCLGGGVIAETVPERRYNGES